MQLNKWESVRAPPPMIAGSKVHTLRRHLNVTAVTVSVGQIASSSCSGNLPRHASLAPAAGDPPRRNARVGPPAPLPRPQ